MRQPPCSRAGTSSLIDMGDRKPRILLMDDEGSILKMIGKRLEVEGFEVLIAGNGQDALVKAKIGNPDLVVLDLMLPELNGFDVCKTLKRNPSSQHIPVIIFTGKGQDGDEALCRQCGADAYVTKTQGTTMLLQHVRKLLPKT